MIAVDDRNWPAFRPVAVGLLQVAAAGWKPKYGYCGTSSMSCSSAPTADRGRGHAGQPDHGTVADRREALKAHVAAADGPLVVLLKHERAPTADINLR